eukprot:CAMPEP_0197633364 /NCGR_PEP_ID=MMETSP1338-20131121/9749_1 /TAXON_ID=43686 ORGANISM="Pelagodinium beii, Strain RCC1491" /NCGR_SAMPLE_ID=MMETSP1338 /ASSEMBLY_ACC=CAM_ASM_000754 /LENGTH=144 /DNA_ID=CAMNT_0043205013 /DNA_START=45 /DNA_END=476 /DNA_ORIENTATION=-
MRNFHGRQRSFGALICLFVSALTFISPSARPRSPGHLPRQRVVLRVEGVESGLPVTPIVWTLGLGIIAFNLFGPDGAVITSRNAGAKWAANFGKDGAPSKDQSMAEKKESDTPLLDSVKETLAAERKAAAEKAGAEKAAKMSPP